MNHTESHWTARMVAALTPAFITDRIWQYEGSIYKK